MYLVAGVSGRTGKVVADRLLSAGAAVRVLVREPGKGEAWAKLGAEVAVADLGDQAAMGRALDGVKGAWLLLPPFMNAADLLATQRARVAAIAGALRDSNVQHIVLLSSIGAQHAEGTGPIRALHHAEQALAGVTPRTTWLRAAYFLENWAGSLGALKDSVFPTFVDPDRPIDMVATADIGRVAADTLLAGGLEGNEIIELASGPGPYTPRDIARVAGRQFGRPLRVVFEPTERLVPTFTQMGASENVARLFEEMTRAVNHGQVAWSHQGWFFRGPHTAEDVVAKLLG